MEKIGENLWLGGWSDAISKRGLKENAISAVLNVAEDQCTSEVLSEAAPELLAMPMRFRVPLIDGPGNRPMSYLSACILLNHLLELYENVLVHCMAGMSRSPTIAATVLAFRCHTDVDSELERIVKIRPVVSPNATVIKLARWSLRKMVGLKDDGPVY